MRRHTIIIGNSGDKKDFLEGVEQDIHNFQNHLKSRYGGAWEEREITTFLNNATKERLSDAILGYKNLGNDFFLIIFTGHGYCDAKGETFFELKPNGECISVSDVKKMVGDVPTLLIGDSCHSVYVEKERITESRLKMFGQGGKLLTSQDYRNLFNNQLELLRKGTFIFASSSSFGQPSADTSKGGLYIYALMTVIKREIEMSEPEGVICIGYIHNEAKKLVVEFSEGKQIPEIFGIERNTPQPPLVVIL